MKKKLGIIALVAVMLLAVGCESGGSGSGSAQDDVYNIGVIQLVEHSALDNATAGFVEVLEQELGDKVNIEIQNAQGEIPNCTTIATKFVNDGMDLILANATPAAQAAAQATSEIPIVGTSITDYVVAGLVDSNEAPGRNISGTSDLSAIDKHVLLMQKLCPDVKKVGVVYCSSEDNSIVQAEEAEKYFAKAGYEVVKYTAADTNEIQPVLSKVIEEVDGVYIPTDNLFANNMEMVKNATVPAGIPVICGEENMVKVGGLATFSVDYHTLGKNAGLMAIEVLKGKDISTLPVGFMKAEELKLVINEEIREALGVKVPEDMGL